MGNNRIAYTSRSYADIRTDLVNMARQYYPDIFNDYNDASVGMMLLELNAAVGDMLSFNTDRSFQETQIDYAQQKKSVLAMARTFGLKVPGKRPSVTLVDISATLPVFGDSFDISYAPLIRQGSQFVGNGKVFQLTTDCDFSSPFTVGGVPNRIIIPNIDSNNNIINYTVTKRELVDNGLTKIFTKVIGVGDAVPFLEVVLPDNNVLSVQSVITLPGTTYTQNPTLDQFLNINNQWFEMDSLAEDKIFIPDLNNVSTTAGVVPGKWLSVTQKFIREYTDLGFTKLIFGAGTQDLSSLNTYTGNSPANALLVSQMGDFINNMSLGMVPTPNTTMFVQYTVGGGADTNLGSNAITSIGTINITVNGSNSQINNAVIGSLSVNNLFPALGGRDEPSVEEIRNLVRYNFSSQNRAVTLNDYRTRIALMDGQFGAPFRCGVFEEQNKIQIYIIGLDQNGNLSNSSNSTLQQNIATYLQEYRMLNDYVEVTNGRIYNISLQVDLYINQSVPQSQIISQVINDIQTYMDVNNFQMGDNIYLSNLLQTINSVAGVMNVIDIRVYNKVGGNYSPNQTSQPYVDATTGEIDISENYTLYGDPTAMYEIKFPATDIQVRVKT